MMGQFYIFSNSVSIWWTVLQVLPGTTPICNANAQLLAISVCQLHIWIVKSCNYWRNGIVGSRPNTPFVVHAVHKSNALQLFCIQICQIRHSTFSNHLSIWRTCYIWALVVPSSNHLYITLYFYKQYVSASTKKWLLHSFFPHVLSTVPTFFIPLLWSRHHYIN